MQDDGEAAGTVRLSGGSANGMPLFLIRCLAWLIRRAMVDSGTRKARANSVVVSPPTARSVSAICASGDNDGTSSVSAYGPSVTAGTPLRRCTRRACTGAVSPLAETSSPDSARSSWMAPISWCTCCSSSGDIAGFAVGLPANTS